MSFFTFLEKKGNFGVFEEFFGEFGYCADLILGQVGYQPPSLTAHLNLNTATIFHN